ncbi:MAG: FAD-dependent oxidoreductase, partial [Candidatus Micrarchaeaceae archaeon]
MEKNFDVIIVGGGVTGTSLLYMLSRYTKIRRVLLIEKYGSIASLNSNSRSNSQTLHFGDIETNYTLEKSKKVKEYAEYLLG